MLRGLMRQPISEPTVSDSGTSCGITYPQPPSALWPRDPPQPLLYRLRVHLARPRRRRLRLHLRDAAVHCALLRMLSKALVKQITSVAAISPHRSGFTRVKGLLGRDTPIGLWNGWGCSWAWVVSSHGLSRLCCI